MALQTIMAEFYSLYFKLYLQLSLTSKTFSSFRKTFLCTCCDTVPDDVKKKNWCTWGIAYITFLNLLAQINVCSHAIVLNEGAIFWSGL